MFKYSTKKNCKKKNFLSKKYYKNIQINILQKIKFFDNYKITIYLNMNSKISNFHKIKK